MRILIHALAAREYDGAARHLRGFLPALAQAGSDASYTIYVDESFCLMSEYPNVEIRRVKSRGSLWRLWWDQVVLPQEAKRERADIIWALLCFGALRPWLPQIMWQRGPTYYCDHHLAMLSTTARMNTALRRQLLRTIMGASARIITPTAAMRDMIRTKHPDIPAERFTIIPHAFDPISLNGVLPQDVRVCLQESEPQAVKLLYVGHLFPYKGLFILLDALSQAVQQSQCPVRLFLTIAREDWPEGYDRFVRRVMELGLSEHVVILGKVAVNAIGALYRACDVLVYPSLCESFGFPLMEAMCLGLPIVAADTPVNRELAGDAARYYQATDVSEAAGALCQIIEDASLRQALSQASRAQFESVAISWDEYARRCLEISQEAI